MHTQNQFIITLLSIVALMIIGIVSCISIFNGSGKYTLDEAAEILKNDSFSI
jgi:hypothetical protein